MSNATVFTYGKALMGDVEGTGQGEHVLQHADVTITSAQLLALNATPQTLVAAPGSGKALVFGGAVAFLDYNSAAYAVDAADNLQIRYTDGSGQLVAVCETDGFLTLTADAARYIQPLVGSTTISDITPVANAALVAFMASSEVITGDSPLKLRVYYRVVPTSL